VAAREHDDAQRAGAPRRDDVELEEGRERADGALVGVLQRHADDVGAARRRLVGGVEGARRMQPRTEARRVPGPPVHVVAADDEPHRRRRRRHVTAPRGQLGAL
jgi:hypothetical protein